MIYDWQRRQFIESDGQFLLDAGGFFETLKIVDRKIMNKEAHVIRLQHGLSGKGYVAHPDFHALLDEAEGLLEDAQLALFNVIKCVYFPKEQAVYFQFRAIDENDEGYQNGVRLRISMQHRRDHADAAYKMTDRKEALRLREEAKQSGYFEVVYQSDDKLMEGTVSNLFFIRGGTVYTPPLSEAILAGTMRKKVIDQLGDVVEMPILMSDLENYESCFITNALIGIMPVVAIDTAIRTYTYDIKAVKQLKAKLKQGDNTI